MDTQTEIQNEKSNQGNALLPLDVAERVVSWRVKDSEKIRSHFFPRLRAADWALYFKEIRIETEGEERLIDFNSAALKLYRRLALRAEGYAVAGGGKLTEIPNWRDRVPIADVLKAVELLTKVEKHEGDDVAEIEPEAEIVALDALWNGSEPGSCSWFRGLVHRFTPPTGEHRVVYSRETGRSIQVRGAKVPRTIYVAKEGVLVKLYDELVISVEGYSVGGKPLEGRDAIRAEMDAFHKIAAVGQIFSTIGEDVEEAA
jgi:hypothetical protein